MAPRERDRTVIELVQAVIERLRNAAGAHRFDPHRDKLIFAVCVHSIACWLLPLVFDNDKRTKRTGCLDAINDALRKKNEKPLSTADGAKDYRRYQQLSRPLEKRRPLRDTYAHNESLQQFIDALATTTGVHVF